MKQIQTFKFVIGLTIIAVGFGLYSMAGFPVLAQEGDHMEAHDAAVDQAGARIPSEEGAKVYIISPKDGDTVTSPVLVQFGLSGMGIAPAGVEWEKTGHHHLIIDAELPSFDDYIPTDENHKHFGGGQTEALIDLETGTHSLQLLFADQFHLPHDPAVFSEKITITVE